ncbi:hypothetical protein NUW58_g7087 [Xylaria curta]|uniref:Uncharacterized protein n=1 Tax=Xylaria curta TaxID=42375 RepID=A0ACC1NLU8_9PEZI|nr:hypothetical protein NUW58_g7087 [Xylaria curta]
MIEPTPEYQRFYDQKRREMDKQRLEHHITEGNSLEPPQGQPMSRSTTSDSLPSPSTVCSHVGDDDAPVSPNPTTEAARSKPHRGRRKGPLEYETRIKTAFKRKFKLTCEEHQRKKVSCKCFDFSKLEEGYRRTYEGQNANPSRSPSVRSLSDLGTFGAGGAAPTSLPVYQNFDLPELPTDHESATSLVSANLRQVFEFDIQSAASVTAMVSAPSQEPFFLSATTPVPEPTEFAIGSLMPFHNRWGCQYQHLTDETRSQASTDTCSWTGPLDQLRAHFIATHRDFRPAQNPFRGICLRCHAVGPSPTEERTCAEPDECSPNSWQTWYFGVPCQSNPNPRRVTVSEASGSRSSWISPPWGMTTPGSSSTDNSFLYPSYDGNSGFYEHSASGTDNNEASDDKEKDDPCHEDGGLQNRCQCHFDAASVIRRRCIRSGLLLSRRDSGHKPVLCDPHLNIPLPPQPRWYLILPLLAPLLVLRLLEEYFLIDLSGSLLALLSINYILKWYLALVVLGYLIAWTTVEYHRARFNGVVSKTVLYVDISPTKAP